MKLFSILLTLHILTGFTALISGIVPMIAKKGGYWHNLFGRIYFWAMFGVFITSLPMAFMKGNVFLFTIAVFSFYFVLTGYRFSIHKGYHLLTNFDKAIMWTTFVTSIVMIGYAIHWYLNGSNNGWIILMVFGSICFGNAFNDLRKFGNPGKRNHWVIEHLNRMAGGYIATFTAFIVTNLTFLPILVGWLGPTFIGVILMILAGRRFKKKFNVE